MYKLPLLTLAVGDEERLGFTTNKTAITIKQRMTITGTIIAFFVIVPSLQNSFFMFLKFSMVAPTD
jgi:predicted membrane protein